MDHVASLFGNKRILELVSLIRIQVGLLPGLCQPLTADAQLERVLSVCMIAEWGVTCSAMFKLC